MKFIMRFKLMIILCTLAFCIISIEKTFPGTCTTISRTNNSANAVLTSAKYNTDLNTSYSNQNAYDLGCGTDGTLEAVALNSTDFGVLLNGIREGCGLTRSDSNTISVDRCMLSINGNFVKTTASNTVTWGCTACSAEAASSDFYLYALDGSTGTTLNLLINQTAPNGDGYDASNNRILGKFFNDANSDIATGILNWYVNQFAERKLPKGVCYLKEVQPQGTQGGTFTSGAWQTRTLNNLTGDCNFLTLSSDQFTLTPGTYEFYSSSQANSINQHKTRLRNITDSTNDIIGTSARGPFAAVVQTAAEIIGRLTITSEKTFEVQHFCTTTKTTDGFGVAFNVGVVEVFTHVKITKVDE